MQTEIQENERKIQKLKEEILKKITDLLQDFKKGEIERSKNIQDSDTIDTKMKELKTDINKSTETSLSKSKEELLNKITTCLNDVKSLEKKIEGYASSKNSTDSKEVNEKLKQSKEEIQKNVEFLVSKCREELNVKVTLAETKTQKIKEDLLAKSAANTSETKALGN